MLPVVFYLAQTVPTHTVSSGNKQVLI